MKKFVAKRPPMGCNSWDCYGAGVTEDALLANARYMSENLRDFGWEYDIDYYFIAATNYGLYQVPFLPRRIREEVVDDFQGDILGDDNRLHRFL